MTRKALGRGLSALIPTDLQSLPTEVRGAVSDVAVAQVKPNPYQPRLHFKEAELKELADSIAAQGMLQPIVVLRQGEDYILIAGERRLRAAKKLGYQRVPAVIKDSATREQLAEWGLIENIQREGLNPMEEARAYKKLRDEFNLTQEQVADKVGKDRSSVANCLRLLNLPLEVQQWVEEAKLSMGHARALLSVENPVTQKALAASAMREGWSVREMERQSSERAPKRKPMLARGSGAQALAVKEIEEKLRRALGTKAKLKPGRKGGVIEISYYSEEELERLLEFMNAR